MVATGPSCLRPIWSFQALRIGVNDELGVLLDHRWLQVVPDWLVPGGMSPLAPSAERS